MAKYWRNVQYILVIILIIGLGWLVVNKENFKEESISSLEFALRVAKIIVGSLKKCFVIIKRIWQIA